MCLEFLYSFYLKYDFILRSTERDTIGNVYRSSCKVPFILVQVLVKLEFSRQLFEKFSTIKFHETPSSGSRVAPCGQTDRHDEADSRLLQFAERA
jgi:hypothetical protein